MIKQFKIFSHKILHIGKTTFKRTAFSHTTSTKRWEPQLTGENQTINLVITSSM